MTLIHVFGAAADHAIGWLLVATGVLVAPVGIYRYIRVASHLRGERS